MNGIKKLTHENIKNLNDQSLILNLKNYVAKERKLTALIIDHLHEVEKRKLYCDYKYTSLFSYCVKELGYSEDQAYRRINAMRIAAKVPRVKKELSAGTITLSNINLFSAASNELKLDAKEQDNLLSSMKHHSKRECESIIQNLKKEKGMELVPKREHARTEASGKVRMSVSIDRALYEKIQKIRHEKNLSLEETFAFLVDGQLVPAEALPVLPPLKAAAKRKGKVEGAARYIPRAVKADIIKRDKSKCNNCGSTHKLQLDHITPIASGGKSKAENLRLLCRNCNLRSGIQSFGLRSMKRE